MIQEKHSKLMFLFYINFNATSTLLFYILSKILNHTKLRNLCSDKVQTNHEFFRGDFQAAFYAMAEPNQPLLKKHSSIWKFADLSTMLHFIHNLEKKVPFLIACL
jgi:hypothetical protein